MNTSISKAFLYDDLINLSIGDPDFNTDIRVVEKACQDAKNGYTHYANPFGDTQLREEIVKFQKDEYNIDITTDELMVTTGGSHAMYLTMQALLDDGDEVIIPEPYFASYEGQVQAAGGKCVYLPTVEETGFEVEIDKLEKLITDKTRAILINTPCNPTASCYSKAKLKEIADVAIKYDLCVVADDIYTIYSYSEPFTPIASLPEMLERSITVRSFSKDFSMTGWRLGYIMAPKAFIDTVKVVNDCNVYSAPTISQRAALYALQLRKDIQPATIKEVKKRMDYAFERIENIDYLSLVQPGGSIYMFINIKKTGLSSAQFCNMILEKAHILAIPGNAFGEHGEGYIRISLVAGIDTLKEAFDRLENLTF